MPSAEKKAEGFERVFDLVGGHGKFQWRLLLIISIQLIVVTWHHIGFVFLGVVPDHWCLIPELKEANWTTAEIKRLAIPPRKNSGEDFYYDQETEYDQCHYYNLNYYSLATTSDSFADAFAKTSYEGVSILPCEKWEFDRSIFSSTVPTEFELVCDRRWKTATIQSSYMAGGLVGTVLLGCVSDKFLGRRKTVLVSLAIVVVCGTGAAFAKSYWIFLLLRFFISIGVSGAIQNCFVLMMEHSDIKYRAALGILEQIPFGVGYMILPLLAYFIRDWSMLQLAFGIGSLSVISYWWILPSSPRWLAMRGREEESVECLIKMARVNNLPEPSKEALIAIIRPCHGFRGLNGHLVEEPSASAPEKPALERLKSMALDLSENFKKLMLTAEIRKRSLVFWSIFMTVSMVYYGIVFSTNLTSDPFILVFLSGLMEIPAYILTPTVLSKVGRRPTTSLTFILTGICMIALSQLSSTYEALRIVLAMLAKLFISSAFAIIYLLGAELYPTEMRTTGLAVGIFCGRVGAMTAPFVVDLLAYLGQDFPTVIFGVSAAIAGLVSLGLPETSELEMADQVYEVEKQGEEVKRRMSVFDGMTQL